MCRFKILEADVNAMTSPFHAVPECSSFQTFLEKYNCIYMKILLDFMHAQNHTTGNLIILVKTGKVSKFQRMLSTVHKVWQEQ
jgi:hypothetical protein